MYIVTLKTDNPKAELALFDGQSALARHEWHAHYELAETLHATIRDFLAERQVVMSQIEGLVIFAGPGSFTGLRIGVTVANATAQAYDIPIVGEQGDNWQQQGIQRLLDNQNDKLVLPEYGSDPHITLPKK